MYHDIVDVALWCLPRLLSEKRKVRTNQGTTEQQPTLQTIIEQADVHCKAFTVGFVSTAFTLLPFIVGYAHKHNMELDPSNVVVGLAKISAIGGIVFMFLNRGNKAVHEDYARIFEFIEPYIPLVLGGFGKSNYEPVFQEMTYATGTTTSATATTTSSFYKPGLANPAVPVNRPLQTVTPSNPFVKKEYTSLTVNTTAKKEEVKAQEKEKVSEYKFDEDGTAMRVVYDTPLIPFKEPDIGVTVYMESFSHPKDPSILEVNIEDMNPGVETPRELIPRRRHHDLPEPKDPVGSAQENFEFDRDALYDFDSP